MGATKSCLNSLLNVLTSETKVDQVEPDMIRTPPCAIEQQFIHASPSATESPTEMPTAIPILLHGKYGHRNPVYLFPVEELTRYGENDSETRLLKIWWGLQDVGLEDMATYNTTYYRIYNLGYRNFEYLDWREFEIIKNWIKSRHVCNGLMSLDYRQWSRIWMAASINGMEELSQIARQKSIQAKAKYVLTPEDDQHNYYQWDTLPLREDSQDDEDMQELIDEGWQITRPVKHWKTLIHMRKLKFGFVITFLCL